jgi:hypothetical protein
MRTSAVALACLLSLLSATAPARSDEVQAPFVLDSVKPLPDLNSVFHQDGKWRGADGACSIALNKQTALWFFGDTFVIKHAVGEGQEDKDNTVSPGKDDKTASSGKNDKKSMATAEETKPESPKKHAHAKSSKKQNKNAPEDFLFINNTAARYDLTKGRANFLYGTTNGATCAVFLPQPARVPRSWYWPGDGLLLNGKLYVICKRVIASKAAEANFAFTWSGDDCAVVDHPELPVSQWQTHYFSLGDQAGKILLGTACYADKDYVYFYSSLPNKVKGLDAHPTGVARLKRSDFIGVPSEPIQYWTGSAWSKDPASSAVLFADGAPEMTVTKLKGEPYLVATYMPPASARICLRFSAKPEGPWSKPIEVYNCPEGGSEIARP